VIAVFAAFINTLGEPATRNTNVAFGPGSSSCVIGRNPIGMKSSRSAILRYLSEFEEPNNSAPVLAFDTGLLLGSQKRR